MFSSKLFLLKQEHPALAMVWILCTQTQEQPALGRGSAWRPACKCHPGRRQLVLPWKTPQASMSLVHSTDYPQSRGSLLWDEALPVTPSSQVLIMPRVSHICSISCRKDNASDSWTECHCLHCGWREAKLTLTALDIRLTPAHGVGSLCTQDHPCQTAAGRWICRVIHIQLQQELPLSTGHSNPHPKDRTAPGCVTVKPQYVPRRRARRSCCSEKFVCPRQTAAGHCFSMNQTSGNTPVPSCFAVWRFPPTSRMCKQALGRFLFAVPLLLHFLQVPVPGTAQCSSTAA